MIIIDAFIGSLIGVFFMWMLSGCNKCKDYPKFHISNLLGQIRELEYDLDRLKKDLSIAHTKYSNVWRLDIPQLQKLIMELEEENILLKKKLNSYFIDKVADDKTTV